MDKNPLTNGNKPTIELMSRCRLQLVMERSFLVVKNYDLEATNFLNSNCVVWVNEGKCCFIDHSTLVRGWSQFGLCYVLVEISKNCQNNKGWIGFIVNINSTNYVWFQLWIHIRASKGYCSWFNDHVRFLANHLNQWLVHSKLKKLSIKIQINLILVNLKLGCVRIILFLHHLQVK